MGFQFDTDYVDGTQIAVVGVGGAGRTGSSWGVARSAVGASRACSAVVIGPRFSLKRVNAILSRC